MDIFKIVALGFAATTVAIIIKNQRPEISIQISVLCSIIIFLTILPYLLNVINIFQVISDKFNIDIQNIKIVLKIIGIAYIAQFGSEICKDAGECAIASKLEFAGKIIVTALSMPIIFSLISMITSIIP